MSGSKIHSALSYNRWWLTSPFDYNNGVYLFRVIENCRISDDNSNGSSNFGIRPVISLKPDTVISGIIGTDIYNVD